MKITYNNWVPVIEDFNLPDATENDIRVLANIVADNTLIFIPNAGHLSPRQEQDFCEKFGELDLFDDFAIHVPDLKRAIVKYPDAPGVARVTGKLDDEGLPGLHGHKGDLDWHCNKPMNPNRKPLIWLMSIEHSVGSRTSWINFIDAYNDLSSDVKDTIANYKLRPNFNFDGYSELNKNFKMPNTEMMIKRNKYRPPLIRKNQKGHTVIYWPFLQMDIIEIDDQGVEMVVDQELSRYLRDHLLNEKYVWHNDWQDNQIVLADQDSGVHKRWAFDNMEQRLLHRIACDYTKVKW